MRQGRRRTSGSRRGLTRRDAHRSALGAFLALSGGLVLFLGQPDLAWGHPAESERIAILTARIEARPGDPALYIDRGSAYSHDGEYALAMKDLQQAAQLADPVSVAYELGLLHFRQGQLDEAKSEFDRFLARFPNHASALEQRARLHAKRGDAIAAVSDYDRFFVVTARPNPGSFLSAAKLFADDEDSALALEMLDRGIERLGVIPQLQQYAIVLELQADRPDQALARLGTLEAVMGEAPEWHAQMAELLIRMDRPRLAREHLSNATKALGEMRETPARMRLASRIATIEEKLEGP